MQYRVFLTEYGYMAIAATDEGLAAVTLPCPSDRGAVWLLGKKAKTAENYDELMPDVVEDLQRYFRGDKVDFDVALDLSEATSFQRRIWQATMKIPYGETRNYGWVAEQAGSPKGSRAAGNALGSNPIPVIVPCHRVIAGDGTIGGFSSGIVMKKRLLALEGIRIAL